MNEPLLWILYVVIPVLGFVATALLNWRADRAGR